MLYIQEYFNRLLFMCLLILSDASIYQKITMFEFAHHHNNEKPYLTYLFTSVYCIYIYMTVYYSYI